MNGDEFCMGERDGETSGQRRGREKARQTDIAVNRSLGPTHAMY